MGRHVYVIMSPITEDGYYIATVETNKKRAEKFLKELNDSYKKQCDEDSVYIEGYIERFFIN